MSSFPATTILRHRKENLKKCSLSGLEGREDFLFFRYPLQKPLLLSNYILLTLNAEEELAPSDAGCGILLLDATWRYAQAMEKNLPLTGIVKKRLPNCYVTAYPRRQSDCAEPGAGLASIEAIVCAYALLGRPLEGLLDNYYWKESFLEKNLNVLRSVEHVK